MTRALLLVLILALSGCGCDLETGHSGPFGIGCAWEK